jgi:hypothetical protein
MFSAKLSYDAAALNDISQQARATPRLMATATKRRLPRLKARIFPIVRVEPGRPVYPLVWASAKQRRYVMMKLRRDNNLPYQRTHRHINAYDLKVDTTDTNGVFTLTNSNPAFDFISGSRQQLFHKRTGWLEIDSTVNEINAIITEDLRQTWFSVVGAV